MSASIVQLRAGGQQLTGTGVAKVEDIVVAGYVNTDGSTEANVELREGDASGRIIFKWDSPIATSFWPTVCKTKSVWYSVSGTGAYVMLFSVVV